MGVPFAVSDFLDSDFIMIVRIKGLYGRISRMGCSCIWCTQSFAMQVAILEACPVESNPSVENSEMRLTQAAVLFGKFASISLTPVAITRVQNRVSLTYYTYGLAQILKRRLLRRGCVARIWLCQLGLICRTFSESERSLRERSLRIVWWEKDALHQEVWHDQLLCKAYNQSFLYTLDGNSIQDYTVITQFECSPTCVCGDLLYGCHSVNILNGKLALWVRVVLSWRVWKLCNSTYSWKFYMGHFRFLHLDNQLVPSWLSHWTHAFV